MRGSRKFCQRGSNIGIFLFDEGMENINTAISEHHRPARETPSKLRFVGMLVRPNIEYWLGSFVNFQGKLTPVFLPLIFVIFRRGGPDPLPPTPHPLNLRMVVTPGLFMLNSYKLVLVNFLKVQP